jgi:hypothetical protein
MQRLMAAIAAILVLAAGAAPASARTVIADPARFVGEVYARLAKGGDYIPPEDIYSSHLASLWALEARESPKGEVGRIDFLFWINGQDGTPSNLKIKTVPVEGRDDRRIVVVSFVNGKPQTEQFYFERGQAGWKLDDVICTTPGAEWTLSAILKYGWVD